MTDAEITHSETLRDKIFDYLPVQARKTLIGVWVTYWPNHGAEMELILEYNACDSTLDIEAREGIYGPDEKLTGHYVRGCELGAVTAEIHAYTEAMEAAENATKPVDETVAANERDVTKFDEAKQSFFLNLFENI